MTDTQLNDLAAAFPLARQVLELASQAPVRTLATAESCTAGLLAAAITSVAGSSRIFLGGVVAYANSVKIGCLAVPEPVLEAHGSVSQEVAEAMALGVRARFGASLGIATTGVAGPGSSESKPAGLIYVALAGPDGVVVRQLDRDLGRHLNRVAAVEVALEMAVGALE
ncbi:MAG: CinA family protein [Candidatus Dormiibacterota bacterium]